MPLPCSSPARTRRRSLEAPAEKHGQVGIRIPLERREAAHQIFARLPHVFAQDVLAIQLAGAFPRVLEIAIAAELDERRLETIVIALTTDSVRCRSSHKLASQPAVVEQVVVRIGWIGQQLDVSRSTA